MKLIDGEDGITKEELEEKTADEIKNIEDEVNEIYETGEAGEQITFEETESVREGSEEKTEDGVSDGFEESVETTTTVEVSVDSISMDANLATLGFVPVALFCIIFLLGIIALGGD